MIASSKSNFGHLEGSAAAIAMNKCRPPHADAVASIMLLGMPSIRMGSTFTI